MNKKDFLITGKYLAKVINSLVKEYKPEEIAIACGYFRKNEKGEKIVNLALYEREKEAALIEYISERSEHNLQIIRDSICTDVPDWTDTYTFYLPKRIVEQSKNYDYQIFLEFNFDYLLGHYGCKDQEEAEEVWKKYNFKEPMMFITPDGIIALDHELNYDYDSQYQFGPNELAEFYGFTLEDIVKTEAVEGT